MSIRVEYDSSDGADMYIDRDVVNNFGVVCVESPVGLVMVQDDGAVMILRSGFADGFGGQLSGVKITDDLVRVWPKDLDAPGAVEVRFSDGQVGRTDEDAVERNAEWTVLKNPVPDHISPELLVDDETSEDDGGGSA